MLNLKKQIFLCIGIFLFMVTGSIASNYSICQCMDGTLSDEGVLAQYPGDCDRSCAGKVCRWGNVDHKPTSEPCSSSCQRICQCKNGDEAQIGHYTDSWRSCAKFCRAYRYNHMISFVGCKNN